MFFLWKDGYIKNAEERKAVSRALMEHPERSESKVNSPLSKTNNPRRDKGENGEKAVSEHIPWPKTGQCEVQTVLHPFLSRIVLYTMKANK